MEERLRKLAGVAEAGSFTAAAEQMRISQPALTAAIKKLERELKAELLVRGPQGVTLTPAGRLAYEAAKTLRLHTSNLQQTIANLHNQKLPFTIGAIDAVAELLFVRGEYLPRLQQTTYLSLSIDNSSQILRLLEKDNVELGLIAQPPHLPKAFTATPLGQEPLVLVCSPAGAQQAETDLMNGHIPAFLGYNQQSRTYRIVTNFFAQHRIRATPTFYSTSPHILLQLARAGRGVAALPYLLVEPEIIAGTLARLTLPGNPYIAREIIAVQRTGKLLHPEAAGLCSYAAGQLHALASRADN